MDAPLFAECASEIEKEDFEDEVRNMCSTVVLLIAARRETIKIAGIATSSVGSAANIGTIVAEKILNSKQIKEMNEAFARDKEITGKFETQLDDIKRYKESTQLCLLYYSMRECVGENHLLLPVFQSVLNTKKIPHIQSALIHRHQNPST